MIFFEITFLENSDRYENQSSRLDQLGYEVVIETKTANLRPYHG